MFERYLRQFEFTNFKGFVNEVCLFLHKIIFNIFVKKFSAVLFAYLIKEDVQNVLLLLACKP